MNTLAFTRRALIPGTCVVAVTLLASCAEMPEAELSAAESTLTAAKQADAEDYAYREYSAAAESLQAAQRLIAQEGEKFAMLRNYGRARDLLAATESLASTARETAPAQKEQTRQEAASLLDEAHHAIAACRELLVIAPAGKGTEADLAVMQADLDALTPTLEEARMAIESGNYIDAKAKAKVILSKATSLTTEVHAAMNAHAVRTAQG